MQAEVIIEEGARKVFASAVGWEGWCRSGRTEEAALEALGSYAERYRPIAERAGLLFDTKWTFSVSERLVGNATTDFGAPAAVASLERLADRAGAWSSRAALVKACWAKLDEVVARAPLQLRKGPRGGGRDRDGVARHVDAAELAYGRKLGVRERDKEANRAGILAVLAVPAEAFAADQGWPVAYAARRIAWHVLDHAWEIEDRAT